MIKEILHDTMGFWLMIIFFLGVMSHKVTGKKSKTKYNSKLNVLESKDYDTKYDSFLKSSIEKSDYDLKKDKFFLEIEIFDFERDFSAVKQSVNFYLSYLNTVLVLATLLITVMVSDKVNMNPVIFLIFGVCILVPLMYLVVMLSWSIYSYFKLSKRKTEILEKKLELDLIYEKLKN